MNDKQRKQEADALVKQFLAELDACTTEEERIAKVWELVHGVAKGARKSEVSA
jgi:hypothetical protein